MHIENILPIVSAIQKHVQILRFYFEFDYNYLKFYFEFDFQILNV